MNEMYIVINPPSINSIYVYEIEPDKNMIFNISRKNLYRVDSAKVKRTLILILDGELKAINKKAKDETIDVHLSNLISKEKFYGEKSKEVIKHIFGINYK